MIIDKLKIAHSFSRAAINYDSAAHLQRDVGERLMAMLSTQYVPSSLSNDGALVDVGCGTGYFSTCLKSLCPQATYFGIDIAEGMVDHANKRYANKQRVNDRYPSLHWVCADAERLPFDACTVDCFFSNLTLQWCNNLVAVFVELMRSLKPGGHVGFSTLGPATLWELRAAWQQVDHFIHVNQFYPADHWRTAIESTGLQVKAHSTALKKLQYNSVSQLTWELKTLGAHNMNTNQRQALGGRRKIRQLHQAYEVFRKQGALPATYEVHYWVLHKPPSTNSAM